MMCYLGIIGHDKNIKILKNLLLNKSCPHILFHGASGTGKTSTILDYIYGNSSNLMTNKPRRVTFGSEPRWRAPEEGPNRPHKTGPPGPGG